MLATIIENVQEAIVAKDATNLRYVFVNRAAETLFGVGRSAMLGKTAREVFGLDAAEWIERGDRALLQPNSAPIAELNAIETPGNGRRLIAIRRLPLAAGGTDSQFLLSMIEDRTEQGAPVAAGPGTPVAGLALAARSPGSILKFRDGFTDQIVSI